MKKNILSLIGSIVALASVFFLGAPYLISYTLSRSSSYTYPNTYTYTTMTTTTIQELLGLPNATGESRYYVSGLSIIGILLTISILASFVALIIVLSGIMQNQNVNDKALICSSVNAFTVLYLMKYLSSIVTPITEESNYAYVLGWGIICVIVLFAAFFILSLLGFIISNITDRSGRHRRYF